MAAKQAHVDELKNRAIKLAQPMKNDIRELIDSASQALEVGDEKEYRRKIHDAEHALVGWELRQLGR